MNGDRAYISRLVDIYGAALSPRQRDVVDLYYNEDLSLAEISENCGITRQGVRDAIRHGVETLHSLEAALGFYAKSEKLASLAADIVNCNDVESAKIIAEAIIGEL
ncbi:MAG: DNA-binding protein [Clostridia bacterium]|nr:DNA-binding protein [Clostridia bacterium]